MKNAFGIRIRKYNVLSLVALATVLNVSCTDLSTTAEHPEDTVVTTVKHESPSRKQVIKSLEEQQKKHQAPQKSDLARYNEIGYKNSGKMIGGYWNEVVEVNDDGVVIRDCYTGKERIIYTYRLDDEVLIARVWASKKGKCNISKDDLKPGDIIQVEIDTKKIPGNVHVTIVEERCDVTNQEYYDNNDTLSFKYTTLRIFDLARFDDMQNSDRSWECAAINMQKIQKQSQKFAKQAAEFTAAKQRALSNQYSC